MTRRKRLLSLLLSVLMLCTLLPPRASAAPTLYFTAVNDRMCDLSDETMPFWQNGLLYVAGATVDGPDDLGIRYSYNQEKSVAILYKGQRVLYCDLTAGTMENNRTGEQYTGSPIVRSGMVFFPITALAKMFDLKYSSTKIAYGYLLRIRDDNAVLSDEYFIDAATDPIQKRYAQYERAHAAAESEQPVTPPPVDTPTRRDDLTVYLLLPAAEEASEPCDAAPHARAAGKRGRRRSPCRRNGQCRRAAHRRGDRSGGARTDRTGQRRAVARRKPAHAARLSRKRGQDAARGGRRGGLLSHHDQHVRLYAQRHTLGRHRAQMGRPLHQCAALPRRGERGVLRARHGALLLHRGGGALRAAGLHPLRQLAEHALAVPAALQDVLSRLRAENCTIAALNEVTA